ncbi:MAG: hypothetical protein WC832_12585, partial [Anaerolineales bacterium]
FINPRLSLKSGTIIFIAQPGRMRQPHPVPAERAAAGVQENETLKVSQTFRVWNDIISGARDYVSN